MKNLNILLLVSFFVAALGSCKKDEVRAVVTAGTAPSLSANMTNLVLTQAAAENDAVTVTWTAADFGYKAAVAYGLQLSKKGTNFASATTTEVNLGNGSSLTRTFKVAEIDKEFLKIIPANATNEVEIRVKADVGSGVTPVYSNIISMTVTPYRTLIDYPSLYVPGDYQGWNPASAPKISSISNNKVYEGYVNITASSLEFKLTSAPNWDNTNYGDAGSGKLSTTGGNLKVSSIGYYLIKADLNALTWSATKTTWGIIGNATPNGWDADTPMSFDAATGLWTVTANLTAGEMKFRANNAWDINFGDSNGDNIPDYAGTNIKIDVAGNYTITLDLSVGGNYFYSLKKN